MKKAILGFSGGVDSAVSAVLLRESGFEVSAVYLDMLNSSADKRKAENTAKLLELPFYSTNVSKKFHDCIISRFLTGYAAGKTPNPCIWCNPEIKFQMLSKFAEELGAKYIATGHYAKVKEYEGSCYIYKAACLEKDQSYMLARLGGDLLRRVIFPLGDVPSKKDVRRRASELKLPNADEKDSQDVCFIRGGTYRDFLKENGFKDTSGLFTDREGQRLGSHKGFWNFTIGQRKGLGIAFGERTFVTKIDAEKNIVFLGSEDELFKGYSEICRLFFTEFGDCGELPQKYENARLSVKLRYTKKETPCTLFSLPEGRAKLIFDEPVKAPTPGQAAVLYDGNRLVGGGIIDFSGDIS